MSILNQISIIVEVGINHGGSLAVAREMVLEAVNAGATFIKHQTHIPDQEMTDLAKAFIPDNADCSLYDLIEKCALSEEEELELMRYTVGLGAVFFSSPFSLAAVDRLERFGVPLYKIGSGQSDELIRAVAATGKPVILSTGMADIESVKRQVNILRAYDVDYALLHCTNLYPTLPEFVRLGAIAALKNTFPEAIIGLSDHTTSNYASYGAVALGADIIERHYKLANMTGPDIPCSMDVDQLIDLIAGMDVIKKARGGEKDYLSEEDATRAFAQYSVVANQEIQQGEELSFDNLTVKRFGGGDFQCIGSLCRQKATRAIPKDEGIRREDCIHNGD